MASHHYYFHCLRRSGGIAYDGMTMTPPPVLRGSSRLKTQLILLNSLIASLSLSPSEVRAPRREEGGKPEKLVCIHGCFPLDM